MEGSSVLSVSHQIIWASSTRKSKGQNPLNEFSMSNPLNGVLHSLKNRELLSKLSIDFHPLAYSHMRNPKVSTEILGNISQGPAADASRGSLYAVATLDGTLMLVQDEQILW